MARVLILCSFFVALASACGDDSGPPVSTTDLALSDASDASTTDTMVPEVQDTVDGDILYVGYLCEEDEACSTGLCYGQATSQGFFEPPKCQSRCLEVFDYLHYCDSDDDCCRGTCCLDCGAQEGLCVLP